MLGVGSVSRVTSADRQAQRRGRLCVGEQGMSGYAVNAHPNKMASVNHETTQFDEQ